MKVALSVLPVWLPKRFSAASALLAATSRKLRRFCSSAFAGLSSGVSSLTSSSSLGGCSTPVFTQGSSLIRLPWDCFCKAHCIHIYFVSRYVSPKLSIFNRGKQLWSLCRFSTSSARTSVPSKQSLVTCLILNNARSHTRYVLLLEKCFTKTTDPYK